MTHIPRLIVKGDPPRGILTLDQRGLVSDHHADAEGSCDDFCNHYIVLLEKLSNCSPTGVYAYAATKDLLAPGDEVQLGTACYRFIRLEFVVFGHIENSLVLKDCATCDADITDPPSAGHCQFTWECLWSCDTESWGTPEIVEQRCVITAVNFDWIFWECRDGSIVARRTTSEPTHPCGLDEADQPVCSTSIEDLQNEGKVPTVPGKPTDELKIQCCQPHCCAIYECTWDCASETWGEPAYVESQCRDKDSDEKNTWFFHECREDQVVYRIEVHHDQSCASSPDCGEPDTADLPAWLIQPTDPPTPQELGECCTTCSYYQLTNCNDPADVVYSSSDLSAYVGQLIEATGLTGCYLVTCVTSPPEAPPAIDFVAVCDECPQLPIVIKVDVDEAPLNDSEIPLAVDVSAPSLDDTELRLQVTFTASLTTNFYTTET